LKVFAKVCSVFISLNEVFYFKYGKREAALSWNFLIFFDKIADGR
jgi:hypothetical protein